MKDHSTQPLLFTSLSKKKISAVFDDGYVSSDTGVMLLREIERQIGLIDSVAKAIQDKRHSAYIDHPLRDLLFQRTFQIACGYEDANDSDFLKSDPLFKIAAHRDPVEDPDLASQPTISRLENALTKKDLYRIGNILIDDFIRSYTKEPKVIVLDLDPTDDICHGHQQLALFNGYVDEYCYMPLHIYEGLSGKLVTTVLRPGKVPTAREIITILERVVKKLRGAWPDTLFILRADSHFAKPKIMDWLEQTSLFYVFGLAKNPVLQRLSEPTAHQVSALQKVLNKKVRRFASFSYAAGTWTRPRRVILRAEASSSEVDNRFIVTNFQEASARYLYESVYCARGKMEQMIKDHKTHLKSDRTSCHSFLANQFRLFLHSMAYVLLHYLRTRLLSGTELAKAQFDTIQMKLLKIGARVEILKTRIKLHLPSSHPFQSVFARCCRLLQSGPSG